MKKLKTGFDTERYRRQLLVTRQNKKLLATYSAAFPEIPDQNTGKFWDEHFNSESHTDHFMEADRNGLIANWLKKRARERKVLNLGVGSGKLESLLYEEPFSQFGWVGTDITVQTLKRLKKSFPKWQFKKQNLTRLGIKNNSFDVVLLLEVLEHISPRQTHKVLSEIYRVLKPKGTFIVSVPVNEGLEEMFPHNPNSHLRVYSLELLTWEVQQAGFKVLEVKTLTAFASGYKWKSMLNQILKIRQANNLILWCGKM